MYKPIGNICESFFYILNFRIAAITYNVTCVCRKLACAIDFSANTKNRPARWKNQYGAVRIYHLFISHNHTRKIMMMGLRCENSIADKSKIKEGANVISISRPRNRKGNFMSIRIISLTYKLFTKYALEKFTRKWGA